MTDDSRYDVLKEIAAGWVVEDSWSTPMVAISDGENQRIVCVKYAVALALDHGETRDTIVLSMDAGRALVVAAEILDAAINAINAEPPEDE